MYQNNNVKMGFSGEKSLEIVTVRACVCVCVCVMAECQISLGHLYF